MRTLLLTFCTWCALAAGANAADVGRYAWSETPDGLARLDTATGSVALCRRDGDQFTCGQPSITSDSSGDGNDLERRLRTLESRNLELEAQVAALEGELGRKGAKLEIPSDEDVDKVMGFLDRTLKRFKGMMKDLEEDERPGVPL